MMSVMQVTALRDDIAEQIYAIDHDAGDENESPEARRGRRDRLQMAMDVLTHVLRG